MYIESVSYLPAIAHVSALISLVLFIVIVAMSLMVAIANKAIPVLYVLRVGGPAVLLFFVAILIPLPDEVPAQQFVEKSEITFSEVEKEIDNWEYTNLVKRYQCFEIMTKRNYFKIETRTRVYESKCVSVEETE